MELLKRIEADTKQAMKDKEPLKVSCLRLTSNALKLKSKDLMRPLTEEEEIHTLKSLAKQRRDACEIFLEADRKDLADKEHAEFVIIETYLPVQLDEPGINAILDQVFAELNPSPKDTGKVMKEAMGRLAGRADGKLVNQLVRKRFEQ